MNAIEHETLWRFVRGDLEVPEFEAWLYAHTAPEALLGPELSLVLLSADYRKPFVIADISRDLEALLRPALTCECLAVADKAIIPMGMDGQEKRFFASVCEVHRHSTPLWWLSLERCKTCGQYWVMAAEERIYDDYFLKRLNDEEVRDIIERHSWPADFLSYESVLKHGLQLGKACRFADPFSRSLIWTAHDLKRERPSITYAEIADLLGVDQQAVVELLSAKE